MIVKQIKIEKNQLQPTGKATLQRDLLARYMLLAGYITYIVQIETGLTAKKIRSIRRSLIDEGFPEERRSRASRTSRTLLNNRRAKAAASLAVSLYYRFGGEKIFETISIEALTKAYSMYVSIIQEVPYDRNFCFKEPIFSISDLWMFANELRSGESVIFNCQSCKCDYYSATEEPTLIDCPFCDTSI